MVAGVADEPRKGIPLSRVLRNFARADPPVVDQDEAEVLAVAGDIVDGLVQEPVVHVLAGKDSDPVTVEAFELARDLRGVRDQLGSIEEALRSTGGEDGVIFGLEETRGELRDLIRAVSKLGERRAAKSAPTVAPR